MHASETVFQNGVHPSLNWDSFLYFRDSLTELENFIDSYAADETDEDDDDGEDEQQKMVNLLKQQMMTNLTLMNTLKQNSAFPAGKPKKADRQNKNNFQHRVCRCPGRRYQIRFYKILCCQI